MGLLALGCVLAAVTAVLFFLHVHRYWFLGDDCFISFRYAQNLTEGHGLVFNPGERVEGYTNFLWVLLMAAVMKAGLAPEWVSNWIGVASGGAILVTVAWLGARRSTWSDPLVWLAPLCLASSRTFCAWCTGGLATQFFSMLVLLGLVCFGRERHRKPSVPIWSSLILAVATLTRPEGGLFFAACGVFYLADLFGRRRKWTSLLLWLVPFVLIVGAHFAWRYSYYGYLLPNTFYAKVSGLWLSQSTAWLGMFVIDYFLFLFAPLALVPVVMRRDDPSRLFFVAGLAYVAYLLYVGGDRFEYRLLTPVLGPLYWLIQEGIRDGAGWTGRVIVTPRSAAVGGWIAGVLLVVATYSTNLWRPHPNRYNVGSLEVIEAYATQRAEEGRFLHHLVQEGYLQGDELIAVGGAGALPYYAQLPTLDYYGLNDVKIAHQEIEKRGLIGHEKRADYQYLKNRGVVIYDVLNRVVWPEGEPPPPYRESSDYFGSVPLRCVEADGRYLVFATTLDEADFRRVFRDFKIIF